MAELNDSILITTKDLIGFDENYDPFDRNLIRHINSALSILHQLGIGPTDGFRITDSEATWSDFIGEGAYTLQDVIDYVYLRVKLLFDPPATGVLVELMEREINEIGYRLNVAVETTEEEGFQNGIYTSRRLPRSLWRPRHEVGRPAVSVL